MLVRLVGIVLGLILATSGYVVAGWGSLGSWAANLDLGPFEPHRPTAGAAATILGAVLIVAALLPRRRATKAKRAPMVFDPPAQSDPVAAFEPFPQTVAAPVLADAIEVGPFPTSEPAPAPEPWTVQAPIADRAPEAEVIAKPEPEALKPEAPKPGAKTVQASPLEPTFAQLRAQLIAQSHDGVWSEAVRTLSAMKRVAETDEELAIAHRDLGDFARGHGKLDEAAEAYETSVGYARLVRQTRPDDDSAELLAGALSGVGDTAEAEGRLDAALEAFEEALALRRSRAKDADIAAQRALSVNLERLADLREDRGHRMRALDLYRESHEIAGRLAAADPARFGPDLAATRERLDELEARIAQ